MCCLNSYIERILNVLKMYFSNIVSRSAGCFRAPGGHVDWQDRLPLRDYPSLPAEHGSGSCWSPGLRQAQRYTRHVYAGPLPLLWGLPSLEGKNKEGRKVSGRLRRMRVQNQVHVERQIYTNMTAGLNNGGHELKWTWIVEALIE